MSSPNNTSPRRRGLAVIAAALAALSVATAGASARAHANDSDHGASSAFPVFVLEKGRFSAFDPLGFRANELARINNRGQIAGSYVDADGTVRGFVRDRRGGFVRIDAPGAALTYAHRHQRPRPDRRQHVRIRSVSG